MRRVSLYLVLVLCYCVPGIVMVKREDFKTCEQASFCNRLRDTRDVVSSIDRTSIKTSESLWHATVQSEITELLFSIDIQLVAGGSVKVKLSPENEDIQRYEPPEADFLNPEALQFVPFTVRELGEKLVILESRDVDEAKWDPLLFVEISLAPFKISLKRENRVVLTFNDLGSLFFENGPSAREGTEEEGTAVTTLEKFHKHEDRRPFGDRGVSLDVSFPEAAEVYGIPEHASSLALKTTRGEKAEYSEPYRLYNLDVFEYETDNPMALYGAIPVMIGHGTRGTVGMFVLNGAEMWIDIEKRDAIETHWMAESGVVDMFLFSGPSPGDVMKQYSRLTYTPYLPPLFGLAYHQCRWAYKDEADVYMVDSTFDTEDIPYDVLWLDIEHTRGKRYMTWDALKFPDSKRMLDKIGETGRRMVTIVDPHIKRDKDFHIHSDAEKHDHYCKDKGGGVYEGWCWPGSSSWIDVLSPESRTFWGDQFHIDKYSGSAENLWIWNDMNEPSVFNGPEVSMHRDAKHFGDVEHRDVHNLYGYYTHRATFEGLERNRPGNPRPFVLTRSYYAGSQRYGAAWTGDNTATFDHLEASFPMILSNAIAGHHFIGADIAGFFGNPNAELFTRFYQAGAFFPFFRGHSHIDSKRREPWMFGQPYTGVVREAIRFRYSLMPYWYSLFYEAHTTGMPSVRPLWVEFPDSDSVFAEDKTFMLGSGLLVSPVLVEGETKHRFPLPGTGPWYDYRTGQTVTPDKHGMFEVDVSLESIPTYLRGGNIIPIRTRVRRSTNQMSADPYTLLVSLDSSKAASGRLFEDDGTSYDYRDKGAYHLASFSAEPTNLQVSHGKIKHLDMLTVSSRPVYSDFAAYTPLTQYERVAVNGLQGLKSVSSVVLKVEGRTDMQLPFDFNESIGQLLIHKVWALVGHAWDIEIFGK